MESKKDALRHLIIVPIILIVATAITIAIVFPAINAFIPSNKQIVMNELLTTETDSVLSGANKQNDGENKDSFSTDNISGNINLLKFNSCLTINI